MISAGDYHSAAISNDGNLWCWGRNYYGQLGNGLKTDSNKPVKVLGSVKFVSLGGWHSAAITMDGSLWCWGYNYYGQLGNDSSIDAYKPVRIMNNVETIQLGYFQSAAVKSDKTLWCWGCNNNGQLGDNSTTKRSTPVKIMGTTIKSQKISVNTSISKTYTAGLTFSLNATAKTNLFYSSSDKTTATVSSSGIVSVKKAGTVIITITAAKTAQYYPATEKVSVKIEKGTQKISVNSNISKTYAKGLVFNLNAKANTKLSYASNQPSIAVVSSGKVSVKQPGEAVITITAAETAQYKKASAKVNIEIKVARVTITSISAKGNLKVLVQWTRNMSLSGYELYYYSNTDQEYKPATQPGQTITANQNKAQLKCSPNSRNKKRLFKIRGYVTVKGKTTYGAWSPVKSVIVK